ncbi:Hypothetical predicted protein [Podarcis lilfordi]|uniref:Uncharacterized protein n=1 Tax=Podarcis lilfordi TaxID=74358 RepID=A0AA35KW38_9SAUR|nr:Hypothetical predicted protein [Podarcis lilfordi]
MALQQSISPVQRHLSQIHVGSNPASSRAGYTTMQSQQVKTIMTSTWKKAYGSVRTSLNLTFSLESWIMRENCLSNTTEQSEVAQHLSHAATF